MLRRKESRIIELPLMQESFEAAFSFIEREMKRDRISREIVSETMLTFEALFHNLTEQCADQNTVLTIKTQRLFGEFTIKLGFEGGAYIPAENLEGETSPEAMILRAYHDKVDYRYFSGYNNIRIVVKRNYGTSLLCCYIGILLAILLYIILRSRVSAEAMLNLESGYVFPLLKQFANMMLMIGGPVTLFSMIKNLTEIYVISERSSSGRRLQIKTVVTSILCILLAFGASLVISVLLYAVEGYLAEGVVHVRMYSFSEIISTLVPSSIIEPFQSLLPFPMIVIALLITYAFCSVSEYFGKLKKVVDVCYALFSKMLSVVMFALPFVCFLAILTPLLAGGFEDLLLIVEMVVVILASLAAVAVFYLIRLLIGGVRIRPFLKRLPPLIRENFKINSAIDAVPFNVRYCARNYGYNRKRLSENLAVLAQTNLDGNCFLIMLISLLVIFMLGVNASWFHIMIVGILVFFLSLGAPNQPGSILIGTLIILI